MVSSNRRVTFIEVSVATYEYVCSECEEVSSFDWKMSEYDTKNKEISNCLHCNKGKLSRLISVPNMIIPGGFSYNNQPKVLVGKRDLHHKEPLPVPINIIDEKPDGSYKVTRIGSKKDIHND